MTKVKVRRKGLNLSHRSGYLEATPFAEEPARYTKELAEFARAALLPAQAIKLPGKPR